MFFLLSAERAESKKVLPFGQDNTFKIVPFSMDLKDFPFAGLSAAKGKYISLCVLCVSSEAGGEIGR